MTLADAICDRIPLFKFILGLSNISNIKVVEPKSYVKNNVYNNNNNRHSQILWNMRCFLTNNV